jgi:hypothetical protein
MGFLDRLLGRTPVSRTGGSAPGYGYDSGQSLGPPSSPRSTGPQDSTTGTTPEDRAAIARYRYLLRTAPPEQIEEAHAQAFAQLNPSQRRQVLQEMSQTLPASEVPQSDDPRQLARAATRAEMQQPGYLQSTFGGRGYAAGGLGAMGGGMMGPFGGSLLGTIAGVVIGTAVADTLLGGFEGSPEHQDFAADAGGVDQAGGTDQAGADQGGTDQAGADQGGYDQGGADQAGYDQGGYEAGGADAGGADAGWGDQSGFGDFGGGDFGGGDFL